WFFEAQAMGQRLGHKLHQMRLRWLEGRLAAAQGRLEVAIRAFQEVRGEFSKLQDIYETALVTLELTATLLRQGDTRQVQKEAAELPPLFEQMGLPLEALATCHLFCRAAAAETATLDMVQQVA